MPAVLEPPSRIVAAVDPYRAWFRINHAARPLNAYQLLGLEPFELSREKIQTAADRRREQLRTQREAADAELWQRVHDELELAVATLTNVERRAVLDARLRRTGPGKAASASPEDLRRRAGGAITCPDCHAINVAERQFCSGCGRTLWDACPQCNELLAVSESFCGACGVSVAEARLARRQQADEQLAEARRLLAACAYDKCRGVLLALATSESRDLERQIESAVELLEQLNGQREEGRSLRERVLEQSQAWFAKQGYDQALTTLEELPAALRDDDFRRLHDAVTATRREVQQLSGEIRELLREQQWTELAPRLDRLLELKPQSKDVRQLAEQLRDRLCATAKRRLAEERVDDALTLLDAVPRCARGESVEVLRDEARELAYLLDEFANAAVIDETLLAVADRLTKRLPNNTGLAERAAQLKQKAATRPKAPLAAVAWTPVPERTSVGCPVAWHGSLQRLVVDGCEALHQHRGRFFTAVGLALQALGASALDLNLLPSEKKGGLRGWLPFGGKAKAPVAAWGLDLSSSSLKAVRLQRDEDQGAIRVTAAELIDHSLPLHRPEAERRRHELLLETLRAFLARHTLHGEPVATNLPSQRVLGRFFTVPPIDGPKRAKLIEFEAQQQVPMPLADLVWAYQLLTPPDAHDATLDPLRVVLLAVRRFEVAERTDLFAEAGIPLTVLQCDGVALHNAVVQEFFPPEMPRPKDVAPIGLLDVGSDATNLVVSTPQTIWFRSLKRGGADLTEALARECQLTFEQAEQVKQRPARARRLSRVAAALGPQFGGLADEVQRSLQAQNQPLDRLIVVGGGMETHGLLRWLRQGKGDAKRSTD